MLTRAILVASVLLLPACATEQAFRQNLGRSHKVERDMTPEQALAILGAPYQRLTLGGVEEWRYCDSRRYADEYLVLYFHGGLLVDKASYTFTHDDSAGFDGCHERPNLYVDKRSPPRRVRALRGAR